MADDPYWTCYLTDDLFEADVQRVFERCRQLGFEPDADSAGAVVDGDTAAVTLSLDEDADVSVYFNLGEDWAWNEPRVVVSVSTMALDPATEVRPEQHTRDSVQERVDALVELTTELVALLDPEYVWGMLDAGPQPDEGRRPTERPIADSIETLDWLTVLGPELVEALGGYERVTNAPGWRVEELKSGHVLVVATDNPVRPTETPPISVTEYLLEGVSLPDASERRSGLEDPFAELQPGDVGADLVADTDDVGSLENDDLELVRCEVDESYHLRAVDDGSFVRRVLGADGPVGEVPADADPADEPVTVLALVGVPPAFVRLDDSDDENVVTMIDRLDVELDKVALLANLASLPDDPDYDPSELDRLESVLSDLLDLDDVDGVEKLVERRLL